LYQAGIRPGDEVTRLNQRPFVGFKDFLYALALDRELPEIEGYRFNSQGEKEPFSYSFSQEESQLSDVNKSPLFSLSPLFCCA